MDHTSPAERVVDKPEEVTTKRKDSPSDLPHWNRGRGAVLHGMPSPFFYGRVIEI